MRKVKWSIRDDGNSTWAKHYAGAYEVHVTDCDGDGTEWEVWLKAELDTVNAIMERNEERGEENWAKHERVPDPIARGSVSTDAIEDFAVGQATAIEALDAICRARSSLPQE